MESVIDTTKHSLYSIGAEPISAEQPCGENVRYESDFEQLEAELAKQESLSRSSMPKVKPSGTTKGTSTNSWAMA